MSESRTVGCSAARGQGLGAAGTGGGRGGPLETGDLGGPAGRELNHRLLAWFLLHRRDLPWREEHDPYRIWISEIMLQQTSSAAAAAFYLRWLEAFPDLGSLARASLEDVLKVWEGLGYYARARNLHRAARLILERWQGRFPQKPEEIRELPGVGDYTAAAVASIAFARPLAAVDTNVIRVASRLLADSTPPSSPALRRRARQLVSSSFCACHPGWVNQAWMELGALVCLPAPQCPICPLRQTCSAFGQGRASDFPARAASRPLPVRRQGLLLVLPQPLLEKLKARLPRERPGELLRRLGTPLLLVRRPDSGLLGGLWELPNFPLRSERLKRRAAAVGIGIVGEIGPETRQRYSHFEARLQPYLAVCRHEQILADWVEQRWVPAAELEGYPRHKAQIRVLQALGLCRR